MIKNCDYCKKEFESDNPRKIMCSRKCTYLKHFYKYHDKKIEQQTKYRNTNREIIKDKARIKSKSEHYLKRARKNNKKYFNKIKAGLLIKDEILGNPTQDNKNLWDGVGEWSRFYIRCDNCGTNVYKHVGRGFCAKCYWKLLNESDLERKMINKERREDNKERYVANHRIKRHTGKKYLEKAINGELEITPKIENILESVNLNKKN